MFPKPALRPQEETELDAGVGAGVPHAAVVFVFVAFTDWVQFTAVGAAVGAAADP